ncbi:MAG: VOC family protein [Bdellovibrionota bacterium]
MKFKKLTPVLVVDKIEPCLKFWTMRLDFKVEAEVPEGDELGFALLSRDGIEVMYQTTKSVAKDIPPAAKWAKGTGTALFIEVSDLNKIEKALEGVPQVIPRRKTFYGADEILVREPAGNLVVFAQMPS